MVVSNGQRKEENVSPKKGENLLKEEDIKQVTINIYEIKIKIIIDIIYLCKPI